MFVLEWCGEGELELPSGARLCLCPGRRLRGCGVGYGGMAELEHCRAAQPGVAVTCGACPMCLPLPRRAGVRGDPGVMGLEVLEVVPLAASAEQAACVTWWRSSITSPKASLIQERTSSQFLGWVHAHAVVSPFRSA